MAQKGEPSYTDLVYDVLMSAGQPLRFQDILDEVSRRRPITTRNPKVTIRSALGQGRQLISLGDGTYGYLPHLLQGTLVRQLLVEKKPANHPLIYPYEIIHALYPSFFESRKRKSTRPARLRLSDGEEVELPLEFFGSGRWGSPMPQGLRRYLVENHAAAGDSLLLRVVDGEAGVCDACFESRSKRVKKAVEARNRELAEATYRFLDGSYSLEQPIWDLAIALLARGFYHSDVAPDPLDAVLKTDPRFVDAGLKMWMLAEFLTPEVQAGIDHRKGMESEFLDATRSAPDKMAEDLSPRSLRHGMERTLADLGSILSEREFGSLEDVNAFLETSLAKGSLPRRTSDTPLMKAQELMYDAWEEPDRRERVTLAFRALQISRDCADAYVLLAEETARSAKEAADLYTKAVAAGERALGREAFSEDVGHFWGILETRPYMRARLGLALSFWDMGRQREAVDHIWEMLRLNPGDNQGVRYLLLSWLLEMGEDAHAEGLLNRYPDEISGQWAYGRALHAFRTEGDTQRSRRLRAEAKKRNPYAPAYLMGRKKMPRESPDMIGIGDEREAIAITEEQGATWRKTAGATAWLGESKGRA